LLGLGIVAAACGGGGASGGFAGDIEFRGEQAFLPGFDFDSGFLPEGSPVTVRATVTAGGGVTVVSRATTDGESLTPVAGSGSLAVQGGLTLEVSAKIDLTGAQFEGVVETFEYAIESAQQTFEPFALDASAVVASMLPAAELGAVPIPGVPGATLVVDVTGGTITTTFAGTCAEAAGGFGQLAGALTMEGTVALGASVEIDIPFVLTESFGPFPIDVPIPAITTALDLGTRSLATGEIADAMGICDGSGTSGGETDPPPTTTTTSHDDMDASTSAATSADTGGDTTDADAATNADATTDPSDTSDDTSTGAPVGDPDYPSPFGAGCPAGWDAVGIGDDPPNAVCSPLCGGGDFCPDGATGNASGTCFFNPSSSYTQCVDDSVCSAGETCSDTICQLPPSHCILVCDDTMVCPDGMFCQYGMCTYLE
jgi:hypothetical protein